MKKLIAAVVLLAACRTVPAPAPRPATGATSNANATGGADAVAAIRAFMDAARQQDLQAMGGVFGSKDGPARDLFDRTELEQRELIMIKCLKHDRYDVVSDAPATDGERIVVVNLNYKDLSRAAKFNVVPGPAGRWYVRQFDINALQDLCSAR